MAVKDKKKRARSEGQKAMRQAEILAAARVLIREVGFEAMTMSSLAERAGLAKGTLYLYVRTKEELFLSLFVEAMEALLLDFKASLSPDDSVTKIAKVATRVALETPLFLPLYARLIPVIEVNVADAPFIQAKRRLIKLTEEYSRVLGEALGVEDEVAQQTTFILSMTLQGAALFDLTSKRDTTNLPDDLKERFAGHAFELTFEPAARQILTAVKPQKAT